MRTKQAERLFRSQKSARKNPKDAPTDQSARHTAARLEFVGDLEFASRQIPHVLAISGWLIHNSQRPIIWGLLTDGSYRDISNQVCIYLRSDLLSPDASGNRTQVGFVAFLESDDTSNDIQLAIGPLDCPTLVCLNVAEPNNKDLEAYFPHSHQMFRFGVARCIAALGEDEAQTIGPIAHFALPAWVKEIQFLEGALHLGVSAGIDHRICTANGHSYVEGWINPENGRKFTVAGCLVGMRSSANVLQRSAFRRPDIVGGEEFTGFAFAGRGEIIAGANPLLLLQSQLIETGETAYAKLNLDEIDEQRFARTFWSRALDIQTIDRRALKNLLSFIGQTPPLGRKLVGNNRSLNKDIKPRIGAIILQSYREAALRNLFVLTSRAEQFSFSDIVLLSPDPAVGDLWWPNGGEIRIVTPVRTLTEALNHINAPVVLVVDSTVMATDNFSTDVTIAAKLLAMKPALNGVVLAKKEVLNGHRARGVTSIPVKVPGIETSAWLPLNKGTTNPPVVLRTSALRSFSKQVWPQPSPDLTVRGYLKAAGQELQWLKSESIEVFHTRPSSSFLPMEQTELLYQIDHQL
jgi:hypothetical protein